MYESVQLPEFVKRILKDLKIRNPVLFGYGGEGWIFEFGDKALKIYEKANLKYLQEIRDFQIKLLKNKFNFDIPRIYEIGEINGVFYTIEKKLKGEQMDKVIPKLNTKERQKLYQSYYDAIFQINSVELSNLPYGQIIKTSESITSSNWTDFLLKKFRQKVLKTRERVGKQVEDYDKKVAFFEKLIEKELKCEKKRLVHCDYYLNNVLVQNSSISAILDFSVHLVVGDPRLDVSGVLMWNGIDKNVKKEDFEFLFEKARRDYRKGIYKFVDLYLLYSSFYYSDMDDPSFSIKNLNDENLWKKYGF